ncbi:MAG: hypothetical protein ACW99F_07925 [Candidatus Hodarchaeales archaeon]
MYSSDPAKLTKIGHALSELHLHIKAAYYFNLANSFEETASSQIYLGCELDKIGSYRYRS